MGKKQISKRSLKWMFESCLKELNERKRIKSCDITRSDDRKAIERLFYDTVDISISSVKSVYKENGKTVAQCSKPFVKKRWDTILATCSEAEKRFAASYPNLSITEEMTKVNASFSIMTYELVNCMKHILLAAAIWILDELELRGKLDIVLAIMPSEDEISDVVLPELFRDSCFDNSVIAGMMYIIQNRNDDIVCNNSVPGCYYINESSIKRTSKIHSYAAPSDPEVMCETNRQKYDYIMSLINPHVVKRVTDRFKEKQWQVFQNYLECIYPHRTAELELTEELLKDLQRHQELNQRIIQDALDCLEPRPIVPPKNCVLAMPPKPEDFLLGKSSTSESFLKELFEKSPEEKELDALNERILREDERRKKLVHMYDSVSFLVGNPNLKECPPPEEIPEDEVPDLDVLFKLSIENPYETCFALLYLLDSGDSMAWLVPLGVTTVYIASQYLPWNVPKSDDTYEDDEYDDEEDESERLAESHEDDPTVQDEANDTDQPHYGEIEPKDWIEEEAKNYAKRYILTRYNPEDGEYYPDEKTKINFAQFIYSESNVVIPRNVTWTLDMAEIYKLSGFSDEESKLLEKFILQTEAVFTKSNARIERLPCRPNDETTEESDEPISDAESEEQSDAESLKREIKRLKEELKRVHDEKRGIKKEADAVKAEKEDLTKELAELKTLVRVRKTPTGEVEIENNMEVTFPYEAKGRYVVFGGHDSWSRAIKPLLKNVRFIDTDTRPNISLILHADVVWIQSNAIGHSDYYKIMEVIRTHDVEIEYFSYASAEKCAEQLALYDINRSE